jgi:hypothetical protein
VQHFSAAFGRPTKEIYSMTGLLVIMELNNGPQKKRRRPTVLMTFTF